MLKCKTSFILHTKKKHVQKRYNKNQEDNLNILYHLQRISLSFIIHIQPH